MYAIDYFINKHNHKYFNNFPDTLLGIVEFKDYAVFQGYVRLCVK